MPHLGYGDILYGQPNNANFLSKKLNFSTQCSSSNYWSNSRLQEKLLEELGPETLKSRIWLGRLCCMYKIINIGVPKYLTDLIPKSQIGYNIRNRNKYFFNCRT